MRGLFRPAVLLVGVACLFGCSERTETPDAQESEPLQPYAYYAEDGAATQNKKPVGDAGYSAVGLSKVPRPPYSLLPMDQVEALADEAGPDEMTMVFVGDIMLEQRDLSYLRKKGYTYPFAATAPLLQKADLTVGAVEGSIADEAPTTKGRWSQRMSSSSLEGLLWAGIDAVSLANNHVHDTGDDGLRETIAHLEQAEIGSFGAGKNEKQARAPWITKVRGVRVALLGGVGAGMLLDEAWLGDRHKIESRRGLLIDDLTHAGGVIEMGTFLYTPETLAKSVKAAKRKADLVIVSLHMGVIYYRLPYIEQVQLAQAAAEAGADLVIGHHAHFWQPVALVGRTPVVFGVGNYTFGYDSTKADESLIVRAVVSTKTRRITRVELFPLATNNRDHRIRYKPRIMYGESARIALEDLNAWSEKLFRTSLEIREDRAVLRLAG